MEQRGHAPLVPKRAVIDIHICGACRTEFNDVHAFLQHKEDGCGRLQTTTTIETQPMEPQVITEVPREPQDRGQRGNPYQSRAENPIGQSNQLLTNQVTMERIQGNHPQQSIGVPLPLSMQQTSSSAENLGEFGGVSVTSAAANFLSAGAQTISGTFPQANQDDISENVKNAGEILANLHKSTLRAAASQGGQTVLGSRLQNTTMEASTFQHSNSQATDTTTILTLEPVNDDNQISATNYQLFPLQNTNTVTNIPVQGALSTSMPVISVNNSLISNVSLLQSGGITNTQANNTLVHINQGNTADGNLQKLILQPANLSDGNFNPNSAVAASKNNQSSLPLALSLNSEEGAVNEQNLSNQNRTIMQIFNSPHLQTVAGVMPPESQPLHINQMMPPNSSVSNIFSQRQGISLSLGKSPGMSQEKKQPRQRQTIQHTVSMDTSVAMPAAPYSSYQGGAKKARTRSVAVKKFHCSYEGCKFTTAYYKDLDRHNRTHTGERPFSCEYCHKTFNRNDKLKIHLRGHTGEKPYSCQMCDYASADSSSLKKHVRTHTGERPFKCQVCQYASRNSSQLIVHLRSHTGDAPFQCQQCEAKFKINTDLKRHVRTHTGEKPYECDMCEYKCSVKSNLNSHKKVNHSSESTLNCVECEFKTSSKKLYKEHLRTHAADTSPEQCETCGYICANKTALKNHMRTHSMDKPFKCDYCSYSSKQLGNVKSHTRKKHPEQFIFQKGRRPSKKIKDTQAGMIPEENSITRQKRLPMCRQGFNCTECSASFVREDSLRSHLKQHKDISTTESLAMAVLQLRNPVIAPNNIAGNTVTIDETSRVETQVSSTQPAVVMEEQSAFPISQSAPQEIAPVAPSFSKEGLVVTSLSQTQLVPENLTLQATPNSYIYSMPHGMSNVTVVPSSASGVVTSQQQQAQQVITGPMHVVPTTGGITTNQVVQGQITQSPLHTRLVQSSVQVFPGLQYPVIRLAGGQFFPESQMIGTQFITSQGGENVVTVLGAPMANFIGQLPAETVQQMPVATSIQQQNVLQAQQHLEQQQTQQFQIHVQDLPRQKPTHDQLHQFFAAPESVISADTNTGAIPLSIQFVPQRIPQLQSAEMATAGVQLPTCVNLETLAQVIDHPLAATQGTVQVLLPPGAQGIVPGTRDSHNPQVISTQPNVLVHMAGVGPGGDNSAVQSTVVPIHLVQNAGTANDTSMTSHSEYKTAVKSVNPDGTGSSNNRKENEELNQDS